MNCCFLFVFHKLFEKRNVEERVSCDNAVIRKICIQREIKSTEIERYLGVLFQFN